MTTRTILISSTQDDRDVEETAEQLPDIRKVKIETGHWIHETEPEKFLAAVKSFLEH